MKDIFLVTPPFTQLNTPYPATAYLKGFLNTKEISSFQMDLGIETLLELFSKKGLEEIFKTASENRSIVTENSKRIFALRSSYLKNIDTVIRFLQGKNPTLARLICTDNYLPEASRFQQADDMEWAFGAMGMQDKAKHLATLFLEDLSDFIVECIDANFGFSRYAESIGQSANSFDNLYNTLLGPQSHIDTIYLRIFRDSIRKKQPKLVCISVPFPGNLYSAFRCAQLLKSEFKHIKVAMGGGFANTELRDLTDTRVFQFFDFITLDDGEKPIELLLKNLDTLFENRHYKRTLLLRDEKVVYDNSTLEPDYQQKHVGTPDYSDLLLDNYVSVIEIANPMHSLWSDGRWNKLTMAHGCYWGKCSFCDVSLDYIKIYEPVAAKLLVDRMEQMIAQTGETGFHFVDEAAPPALMKALAIEIIQRDINVTWWTNIRFEKSFTNDLCLLLKESGCIAVSGGLEVASDRLLQLIEKGVSVAQVARVTNFFTNAGILVHAYLMYGYPTQTIQETIDSLEMVRQLFEQGTLQSGFWHQFSLTTHSPIGKAPQDYGITPLYNKISFANNDVLFKDKTGINHDKFSSGLKKSIFNFMHGIGFDIPLKEWFEFKIPHTTVSPNFIQSCINTPPDFKTKPRAKVLWLGSKPVGTEFIKKKRNQSWEQLKVVVHSSNDYAESVFEINQGKWLLATLQKISIQEKKQYSFQELQEDFETQFQDFELFWYSKPMRKIKEQGLLLL
ncbi:MAG: B12-binding domain-containing radical SAM protein [Flavicella sp.]